MSGILDSSPVALPSPTTAGVSLKRSASLAALPTPPRTRSRRHHRRRQNVSGTSGKEDGKSGKASLSCRGDEQSTDEDEDEWRALRGTMVGGGREQAKGKGGEDIEEISGNGAKRRRITEEEEETAFWTGSTTTKSKATPRSTRGNSRTRARASSKPRVSSRKLVHAKQRAPFTGSSDTLVDPTSPKRVGTRSASVLPPLTEVEEENDDDEGIPPVLSRKLSRQTSAVSSLASPPPSRRSSTRVKTRKVGLSLAPALSAPTIVEETEKEIEEETAPIIAPSTPKRKTDFVIPPLLSLEAEADLDPLTPVRGRVHDVTRFKGKEPFRDTGSNPFLASAEDDRVWSALEEPTTPTPSGPRTKRGKGKNPRDAKQGEAKGKWEEQRTITYVHRGKKHTIDNPNYGLSEATIARSLLPVHHPDFSPLLGGPPRLLFPDLKRATSPSPSPVAVRSERRGRSATPERGLIDPSQIPLPRTPSPKRGRRVSPRFRSGGRRYGLRSLDSDSDDEQDDGGEVADVTLPEGRKLSFDEGESVGGGAFGGLLVGVDNKENAAPRK